MTLSRAELAGLHEIMPDPQAINYYESSSAADAFEDLVVIPAAERRPITIEERQMAGLMIGVEAETWHVWREHLGSLVPKVGDKFTDSDSIAWHVAMATAELLRNRWRLACTRIPQNAS